MAIHGWMDGWMESFIYTRNLIKFKHTGLNLVSIKSVNELINTAIHSYT